MSRKKSKPLKNQLMPRQVKFAQYITEGMSVWAAALRAGYSESDLGQLGRRNAPSESSNRTSNHGLDPGDLMHSLILGLYATKKRVIRHKGKITDVKEVLDGGTRLKTLGILLRQMGAFPSKTRKAQKPEQGGCVQVIIAEPPPPVDAQVPDAAVPQIRKPQEVQPPDNTQVAPDPRPPDNVDAVEYFGRNKKSRKL